MVLFAQAPRFNTGDPGLLNSENELTISLPILNTGTGVAANMKVSGIGLGSAIRLSPPGLPLFIGDLAVNNRASISARFNSCGLAVGDKQLMNIQGTYEANGATFGFAVNRYIIVPSPSSPPVTLLKAHVKVAVESHAWTYTIFNDEPLDSSQFIAAFALDVVAPIVVTGVPEGWEVETDKTSHVLWSAADQLLPFPHHIAPGGSLGGFRIESERIGSESTAFVVMAWDHQSDKAGLVSPDLVLSPSRTA